MVRSSVWEIVGNGSSPRGPRIPGPHDPPRASPLAHQTNQQHSRPSSPPSTAMGRPRTARPRRSLAGGHAPDAHREGASEQSDLLASTRQVRYVPISRFVHLIEESRVHPAVPEGPRPWHARKADTQKLTSRFGTRHRKTTPLGHEPGEPPPRNPGDWTSIRVRRRISFPLAFLSSAISYGPVRDRGLRSRRICRKRPSTARGRLGIRRSGPRASPPPPVVVL